MKYTIVKKFRHMVLQDENGKTIATAPRISQLAPEYDQFVAYQPIYVISDKDGVMSLFDSKTNDYILTDATIAKGSPIKNGVPMVFSKDSKTLYVSPKSAKVFEIPQTDTLCLSVSSAGNPSHDAVFQVHDGIPYALHTHSLSAMHASQIIRYPQGNTVENVYLPLLLDNSSKVIEYLQSHRTEDFRVLARTYASIEGKDKLPQYLSSVTTHFRNQIAENGTLTLDRLGELSDLAKEEERRLEKLKAEHYSAIAEKEVLLDKIAEQLKEAGFPTYTEASLRYMPDHIKKQAQRELAKAMKNPTEEVAALLAERETLQNQIFDIYGSKIQPIDDALTGPSGIADYKAELGIRGESYVRIDVVESDFEKILGEYGLQLPQNAEEIKSASAVVVESTEQTFPEETTETTQTPTSPVL